MTRLAYPLIFASLVLLSTSFVSRDFRVIATEQKVIYDVCFTKGGACLLVADGTDIRWFSTSTYAPIGIFAKGHRKPILALDISADSSLLASGGKDSTIVLWDVKGNNIVQRLNFHQGIVTALQFSPDKHYLISSGTDHKAFVYDLREQKVLYTLANHADDVTSVAFSPNGKIFCTAGADGAVNFYSIASQQPIRTFRNLGFVREISFSPDGSRVVSCGDDSRISIWPVDTASRVGEARFTNLHEKWLFTAKLHQDNQSLVTGSVLGKIEIDIPYGKYFDHLRVAPSDIEFKPHNRNLLILAVATLGQGVLILDASDMKFRK